MADVKKRRANKADMITGIPQYQSPLEQSMRCTCGLRYLVLLSDSIGDAEGRTRERAEMIKALFVDARQTPFMNCSCGEFLDFTVEDQNMMVM